MALFGRVRSGTFPAPRLSADWSILPFLPAAMKLRKLTATQEELQ